VVSKITEWFWKNWYGLQLPEGQNPLGVPQPPGTGAEAVISDGMFCLSKNQMVIPVLSQSTAK
jgi:hypothetical protein